MRIPRFFLYGRDLESFSDSRNNQTESALRLVEPDLIHRITSVLRMRSGDEIIILDNSHHLIRCRLTNINKKYVQAEVLEECFDDNEVLIPVTVAPSLIKGDRFDWCLEKLTELGVRTIVPLVSARSVVRPEAPEQPVTGRRESKFRRWQAIVREAAEQAQRSKIPDIVTPVDLIDYLSSHSNCSAGDVRCICVERSNTHTLANYLRSVLQHSGDSTGNATAANISVGTVPVKSISVVIGPEGGFTADEISLAETSGWTAVWLGRRILRSETAAICAMAQIASLLD